MAELNVLNMEAVKEPKEEVVERINPQNIPPKSIGQRELDSTYLDSIIASFITASSTDTLTNKSIDGDVNTLTDIPAANLKIASQAAGDLLQAASSSAWGRLAIGTVGSILISSGSAAAWQSTRFKVLTVTRDLSTASGTVAYTGVGFQPKAIVFMGLVSGGARMMIGFDDLTADGSGQVVMYDNSGDAAGTYDYIATESIAFFTASGTRQYGHVSTTGSDGFSIAWTKQGTPTGTAIIIAFCIR